MNDISPAKLDYFKKKFIEHLNELEKKEKDDAEIGKAFTLADVYMMQKSRGFPIGTVRVWKGRKFKKMPDSRWRPIYESRTRGAMMSIKAIKRMIERATSGRELVLGRAEQRASRDSSFCRD